MSFFANDLSTGPAVQPSQYKFTCHWPSLVGVHCFEAVQIIQREAPWAQIALVIDVGQEDERTGLIGTPDFKRVKIYCDRRTGQVTRIPVRS